MKLFVLVAGFVLSLPSFGQDAYRCKKPDGSMVIQDSPCRVQGPAPIVQDLPANDETVRNASALCDAAVRAEMKDPEAARVSNIRRGRIGKWCRPNIDVRYYWMVVNGKNSYGGYVGDKPYRCALDMSESTVLGVAQIGEHERVIECR